MNERIQQLEQQVAELLQWKAEREIQQLKNPLDLASKNTIGFVYEGQGATSLTQTYAVTGGGGGNVNGAPKAFVRSVVVYINGTRFEIPSLV